MSRAFVRLRYLAALTGMWLSEGLCRWWVRIWLTWHYDRAVLSAAAGCLVTYLLIVVWLLSSGWPCGR